MSERLYPQDQRILTELSQPLMEWPYPSDTKVYSTPRTLNLNQIDLDIDGYARLAHNGYISMTAIQRTDPPIYEIEITSDGANAILKELVPRPD
jgi:hypothetical protein